MKLSLEALEGPLRQGWPSLVTVCLENESEDLLLLERTWIPAGVEGGAEVKWWRPPLGTVIYDAGADRYRHHSVTTARSQVPFCTGLVLPQRGRETFLPLRLLGTGPQELTLKTRFQRIPKDQAKARLYAPPAQRMTAVVPFSPVQDEDEFVRSELIARSADLPFEEAEVQIQVELEDDTDAPLAQACALAAKAAGCAPEAAQAWGRSRRFAGAWVVYAGGRVHLVKGERVASLPALRVDRAIWRELDLIPPFEPLRLVFHGQRACDLREDGVLPLKDLKRGQQLLDRSAIWELFAALDERDLALRWEVHNPVEDGLTIRDL